MKQFNLQGLLAGIIATACVGAKSLYAADAPPANTTTESPANAEPAQSAPALVSPPAAGQRTFATPSEAVRAFQSAAESGDRGEMREIFGPQIDELLTGDRVQDANNQKRLAAVLAQGVRPVNEGDNKIVLEAGTNDWPMPIPLVRSGGLWHFDTAAGKDEIINRHIGKDELEAIGVAEAYVRAQRQYAGMTAGGGQAEYAQKFKSTPGTKDGLYWPATGNEPPSPFGRMVAEAHSAGYHHRSEGANPRPFYGYYFRILTRQGSHAPGGKKDYMDHDRLTGGFALVAYPAKYGQSGIMTFIVNQEGRIYQRDLGEQTARIAGTMKEYNPTSDWSQVEDRGITDEVSQR